MEASLTINQIEAVLRRTIQEEFAKRRTRANLSEVWATEQEAIELCGKGRKTLYRAIESGRLKTNDVRPNPIGVGYLIRRTALVKD